VERRFFIISGIIAMAEIIAALPILLCVVSFICHLFVTRIIVVHFEPGA
jgi:hypothetical protein